MIIPNPIAIDIQATPPSTQPELSAMFTSSVTAFSEAASLFPASFAADNPSFMTEDSRERVNKAELSASKKNKQEEEEKVSWKAKEILKAVAWYGIAIPAIDLGIAASVRGLSLATDICPVRHIPTSFKETAQWSADTTVAVRGKIISGMGLTPGTEFTNFSLIEISVIGPALEEIVYRGLIQEVLLRRIPRKILQTVAPDYAWTVDSLPVRIGRVILAAGLFAAGHSSLLDCKKGGTLPQFVGGLIYGAQTEATGSIGLSVVSHMAHNGWLHTLYMLFAPK